MSDYTDHNSSTSCCECCCSFIPTLGLTSLFMWLSLRTSNPILSIQDIYIPALNKTLNSTNYTSIYIDIKLDNVNKDKGIHYDPLNISSRHHNYNSTDKFGVMISNYTLKGLYQGHKKNTRRKNWTETYGVVWDDVAVFRLDLITAVRFKIMFWNTKRHKLVVGEEFEVNDVGMKVKKKGRRLKSGASTLCFRVSLLLVMFSTFVLVFV